MKKYLDRFDRAYEQFLNDHFEWILTVVVLGLIGWGLIHAARAYDTKLKNELKTAPQNSSRMVEKTLGAKFVQKPFRLLYNV